MFEKAAVVMQEVQTTSPVQLAQVDGQSVHILVVVFGYCLTGQVAIHSIVVVLPYRPEGQLVAYTQVMVALSAKVPVGHVGRQTPNDK